MNRIGLLTLVGLVGLVAACSSGSSSPTTPTANSPSSTPSGQARFAYTRSLACENGFLNGQPTNAACFIPNGAYNAQTPGPYLNSEPITLANQSTVPFDAPIMQLEAGKRYTFVLSGQLRPTYVSPKVPTDPVFGTLHWSVFVEPPFSTAPGEAVVTFHNASPYLTSLAAAVPFGFFDPTSLATTPVQTLGLGESSPISALPPALISPSAVGFYAVGTDPVAGFQSFPSNFDSIDSGNRLPFNADRSLSLYALDGSGASTDSTPAPSGTPPPSVIWVGSYDNNG